MDFIYVIYIGKTIGQMYHLVKARQVPVYSLIVVHIIGNAQAESYPHTVSDNSVKNLIEAMIDIYPTVRVLVTGVLLGLDLETELTNLY